MKISWQEICKLKSEGVLGIKPLKESNLVCCLKLIWRFLSSTNSLWVNWIKLYLVRKGSLWMVMATQQGSWMWRKLLKCWEIAKSFHRVEVRNGTSTSFWYDSWSSMGRLWDIYGERGVIEMGIPANATVYEAVHHRRRRRFHRVLDFNRIEEIIDLQKLNISQEEDISLWKQRDGSYKARFLTKETWGIIRSAYMEYGWDKTV